MDSDMIWQPVDFAASFAQPAIPERPYHAFLPGVAQKQGLEAGSAFRG
jgi:hypothetical protein